MFSYTVKRMRDVKVGDVVLECDRDYFSAELVVGVDRQPNHYRKVRYEGYEVFDNSVHGGTRRFEKRTWYTLNERDSKPVMVAVL